MDLDEPLPAPRPAPRPAPERAAGLLALLVPAVLGALAVAGIVFESAPLGVFVLLGFPLVFMGAEDALATGPLPWALVWAAIAGAAWWFAGRWSTRAASLTPPGFTWRRWGRVLGVAALLLFGCQIGLAIGLAVALRAVP